METPLAERMRPTSLDSYVGQEHLVGKGGVLRRMLESGRISSFILWGPPGVGKTSIAVSIAKAMGRPCVKISLAGVSDALFLRGTQTVFNNAKPGRIVEAL